MLTSFTKYQVAYQLAVLPLTNDSCTHNNCRIVSPDPLVRRLSHLGRILQTSDAGDRIGIARVDNDASQTGIGLALEQFSTKCDGSSLELVLGEDGSGRAVAVRCYKGNVGFAGISWLYTAEYA